MTDYLPMTTDHLVLSVNQGPERSRLTTFFRLILAIPHLIFVGLWGIGALFGSIVAWFAIVFTGRYPDGLWEFCAGFVRYASRVYLYFYLAADPFPPFSGGPDDYVVQLDVPHLSQYDRLKTALRIFYIIPAYVVAAVFGYLMYIVGFVAWIVIVVTGRQPDGLQNLIVTMLGWLIRTQGLATLVTENYGFEARTA